MANNNAPDYQALVKNAVIEIRKLKVKITELEQGIVTEDIAVIGMACQFPEGSNNYTDSGIKNFWNVMATGTDAVIEAPADRLDKDQFYSDKPEAAGKIISTQGGYLQNIDQFAADFFFIAPREAESLDPQQRMLLENHWRALEDAGISPSSLMGSQTGLFAGICGNDYYHLLAGRAYEEIDAYMASGTAHSTAVGRLAFYLGSQGPAIAVDTACSSSLVALHLACQSLRKNECNLALVSGVNALLSPEYSINFSRAGMLSPEGRCKTFDDSADGYVRGEGCGVVVLKSLADALQDNDNILAVVKGSATNQDGRSSGLTAPNGSAQRQVITQALKNAGLTPEQISYVEAHGTGTSLGDPIEIEALQAVYGRNRKTPLNLGSVKSNIGHLEGAAGIAGLIKTVLMLQHEIIPKQLHFNTPNSHVDWAGMNLKVNQQQVDWQVENDQQRIAGVSSFGFSGSNAHVLLGQAPAKELTEPTRTETELLTVSARNLAELNHLKQSYRDYLLANPKTDLADFCYAANSQRDHFQQRLAIPCHSVEELIDNLQQPDNSQSSEPQLLAFLFTGQGAFKGALNRFDQSCPQFAAQLFVCEPAFKHHVGLSLFELLFTEQGATQLQNTQYAQPALFCFQYALAKTWQSWGLDAEYLLGHSIGEYAAACLAGVFSFEDGLKLVSLRGRLMSTLTEPASMIAVLADSDNVTKALKSVGSALSIAAYNGKANTVVSGAAAEQVKLQSCLDQKNISYVELNVDRAFHSPLMQTMLADFSIVAQTIEYHPPQKAIISTKTGQLIGAEIANADYWVDQIIQPVLFAESLETLQQQGVTLAIEISPQNVLSKMVMRECTINAIPSMKTSAADKLIHAIGDVYKTGVNLDWKGIYQGFAGVHLSLPNYPFARQRYWYKNAPRQVHSNLNKHSHPLIQERLELADDAGKIIYRANLSKNNPAFSQDHRYQDKILIPAAHYLEMAVAAFGKWPCQVSQASYPAPLFLEDDQQVQLVLTELAEGYDCAIYAKPVGQDAAWCCHFKAQINDLVGAHKPSKPIGNKGETLGVTEFYQGLLNKGIRFGAAYQLIDKLFVDGEQQAQGLVNSAEREGAYLLYPPVLDACFQVTGALLPCVEGMVYLQAGLESLNFYRPFPKENIYCYARLNIASQADNLLLDLDIFTEDEECIAQIKAINLKKSAQQKTDNWLYKTQWQPALGNSVNRVDIKTWLTHVSKQPNHYWQEKKQADHQFLVALESHALNYVIQALLNLAWDYQPAQHFNLAECRAHLGILPRYEKLLNRCLIELACAGYITADQDRWQVVKTVQLNNQQAKFASTIEMQLLKQCGQELAGVLTGETDFLPLLFPENSAISVATLYSDAEGFKTLNNSAVLALKEWLGLGVKGRKLKVLEIGAGTGGTTRVVLPLLAAETDLEYIYTDLSAGFFNQAEQNFSEYSCVSYQTLDISSDPKTQGLADNDFDLIIAANVIHATADLNQTLAYIQPLLKASGVLMLLEGLRPQLWVDLIFGLTEGWWAFTDYRLQQGYPLLRAEGWQHILLKTGFDLASIITPNCAATERLCQQSVILTQPLDQQQAIHWLILADQQGVADQIVTFLQQQGDECILVQCGQKFSKISENVLTVNPLQAADFDQLIAHWFKHSRLGQRAVINCWAVDSAITANSSCAEIEGKVSQLCGGSLHLVQALGRQQAVLKSLVCISQNSQAINGDDVIQPTANTLWGLLRVVMQEYPQFKARLVDLEAKAVLDQPSLQTITQFGAIENQTATRGQQVFVPRLIPLMTTQSSAFTIKANAAYLVTGAFGGMGFKLCQWLVEQGAKHLILLARSSPSEQVESWLQQVQTTGVTVNVKAVDVSDYESLRNALDAQTELAGIFHCAGIFADHLLQDYDWQVFSQVFPAKVQGSWNLHQLSVELKLNLDYFVLFSSSASLLAASGLANYVAANSFIDALAVYRQQLKLPALSLHWGVWADTGMAAAVDETRQKQWQVMGVNPMLPELALQAMQTAMTTTEAQVGIIDIDFNKFVASQNTGEPARYFEKLLSISSDQKDDVSSDGESLLNILQTEPDQLQNHISEIVVSVLGLSTDIDPRRGFFELGMDSLTSMELRNRLQRELNCTLDATLTFKYPSVLALSDYLLQLLRKQVTEQTDNQPAPKKSETGDLSLDEQLADIDKLLADEM